MRHTPYKVLAPFLATFLVAVSVVSLFRHFEREADVKTKQKIYTVLAKDAQNRQDRLNKNLKDKSDKLLKNIEGDDSVFIKGIGDLSKSSAEIDVSELPANFQSSWKEYVNAQAERAAVLDNLSNPKLFRINNEGDSKDWNRAAAKEIKARSEIVKISKTYGLKFDRNENLTLEN